jgi:hypothetical protein
MLAISVASRAAHRQKSGATRVYDQQVDTVSPRAPAELTIVHSPQIAFRDAEIARPDSRVVKTELEYGGMPADFNEQPESTGTSTSWRITA